MCCDETKNWSHGRRLGSIPATNSSKTRRTFSENVNPKLFQVKLLIFKFDTRVSEQVRAAVSLPWSNPPPQESHKNRTTRINPTPPTPKYCLAYSNVGQQMARNSKTDPAMKCGSCVLPPSASFSCSFEALGALALGAKSWGGRAQPHIHHCHHQDE